MFITFNSLINVDRGQREIQYMGVISDRLCFCVFSQVVCLQKEVEQLESALQEPQQQAEQQLQTVQVEDG